MSVAGDKKITTTDRTDYTCITFTVTTNDVITFVL